MKRQFPVIVFILLSIIGHAYAQVVWQKLSLPEAQILSLQTAPNGKLYLEMQNGVYTSVDEGNSWNKLNATKWGILDSKGAVCSFHDSTLSYSMDDGQTW